MDWHIIAGTVGLLVIGAIYWLIMTPIWREQERQRRRAALMQKYANEEIVDAIMAQQVWRGATMDQVIESWGKPVDIDETVTKHKRKETWKYLQVGQNRFKQRVFIENGHVVGWSSQ
jgi:hypothetical protein